MAATGTTLQPGLSTRARPGGARLPYGWPLYAIFVLFPLWWILGAASLIWPLMAVPMALSLLARERVRVPRGFGLYLLFFLLKDGPYLVNLALEALPLSQHVKHHLFVKFAAVSRATVKGTVVVAVVQGALGGLAFYFTGIDGSLLWGALMAFLSIIPAVGSAIIWVPAVIYFFATGMLWKGIFLVVFFVVVIGLVDNILRPLLVGKDTKMPDYLILISTLGGMEIYGINGFVIGPLIAALFIACWNILSGRDSKENIEEIDEEFIEEGKNHPDAAE